MPFVYSNCDEFGRSKSVCSGESKTIWLLGEAMKTVKSSSASKPAAAKRGRGRPPVHDRAEILAAAKVAFSKSGYANVSLDKLAARLRTTKGSLYYYSARKVDLLTQITRTLISKSEVSVGRIVRLDAPPECRFVWAMRAHMDMLLSDIDAAKIYFENESDLPPKIRAEFRKLLRDIQNAFFQLASEGCKTGVFEGDPRLMVKHALAIANWPYRWYSPEGRLGRQEFVNNAIEFMLSAFMGSRADVARIIKSKAPKNISELAASQEAIPLREKRSSR